MCGIVGYVGPREAQPILLEGLRRLEYRGYDSAGIATLQAGEAYIRRAAGKLAMLSEKLEQEPAPGSIGIAHTRWASHGRPNELNAHPHSFGPITLVHNGIIENHAKLRTELLKLGHEFKSDTDSEIVAHLIARFVEESPDDFAGAVRKALARIEGAYALVILNVREPGTLIGVKQACPLVVGLGQDENFVASDFPAVLSHTREFLVLEDGQMAIVKREGVEVTDIQGQLQKARNIMLDWSPATAEKGGFKHFMLKEIFEQPQAVIDTLRGRLNTVEFEQAFEGVDLAKLAKIDRLSVVACGTSYHAGLIGKRLIEDLAGIPVEVDFASEFRYRNPLISPNQLVVGISQSGETADTLAALQLAKSRGAPVFAVCNVLESAIPRLCSDSAGVLYTHAGPEISVASTKAFLTQIVSFYIFALLLGKQRSRLSQSSIEEHLGHLNELPMVLERALKHEPQIREVAKQLLTKEHMLLMGRGVSHVVALEGALKIKELSYMHAEAYAAGEMKHGPIALIDENMPVLVLAPQGPLYEKTLSNLEEAKSRGAQIFILCGESDQRLRAAYPSALLIPECSPELLPAVAVLPLQLLAYHLANLRGLDVDQPRNLAKSVTIE